MHHALASMHHRTHTCRWTAQPPGYELGSYQAAVLLPVNVCWQTGAMFWHISELRCTCKLRFSAITGHSAVITFLDLFLLLLRPGPGLLNHYTPLSATWHAESFYSVERLHRLGAPLTNTSTLQSFQNNETKQKPS